MKKEKRQAWLDAIKQLPDKYKSRQAWMNWIEQYKPDLWVTVTFAGQDIYGLHKKRFVSESAEEFAVRRFKQFLKYLNQKRFIFYDKFLLCFLVIERNPGSGGIHIHALIKGIKPELASLLEQRLHNAFGKALVKAFDCSIKPYSAIDYIVDKYVFFQCDNLMFYRINSRYRSNNNKGGDKTGSGTRSNPPLNQLAVVQEREHRLNQSLPRFDCKLAGENLFW